MKSKTFIFIIGVESISIEGTGRIFKQIGNGYVEGDVYIEDKKIGYWIKGSM
jgi:uncharacterized protein YijF (DUF1287 family)